MPYKSKAQEAYFNANKEEIGESTVDEYNEASKGKELPERLSPKPGKKKKKGQPR